MNEKLAKTYPNYANVNHPEQVKTLNEGGDTVETNQNFNELPFSNMLTNNLIESNA